MKKVSLLLLFISNISAQAPDTLWTKTFGGINNDYGNSVQQTNDGGYIIGGSTESFGNGQSDIWLIKTDDNGDTLWSNTFGGSDHEVGGLVQQSQDGGYIIASTIKDSAISSSDGDIWLIKTDDNGDTLWSNTFGGVNGDYCNSVQQTNDGGYIIGGTTRSFGNGQSDIWLIKMDSNGDSTWSKTFGGSNEENCGSVKQTQDGGYIIGGTTRSFGNGHDDMWLIKTDFQGDTLWTRTIGSSEPEIGKYVTQSSDGGYVIIGNVPHFEWAMQNLIGLYKFNQFGEIVWDITLGSSSSGAIKVEPTEDGGLIILGYTMMQNGNNSWLIKLNADGSNHWDELLDGNCSSVQETTDGGYIITGNIGNGGENPIYDVLLMKLMGNCNDGEVELWGECYSIENTTELDLSYIGITGEIPPEIGNLINLSSLILKENQLGGEIPPEISYLTDLTQLDLGGNQFTGEIPPEIGSLTNLNILDLAGNQLTGPLPAEIGNLANLTELELGGNQVMGAIPPEIGNLESLTFIHLEYNQFTGEIPAEIGNLINLVWLNFVHNQLTGEIPSSICNLDMNWSDPNNFNISENQLCLPYPDCIEDYVGDQDTTNCVQVSIMDETFSLIYKLHSAYPNPFNPVTTLNYDLPEDELVNITIYDMMGRVVKTLINYQQTAGYKSIQWNATNDRNEPVSAGIYLYTIQAGKFRQTRKMVLLK